MPKRGRPRKHGKQPAWMLGRAMIVLHAFHAARQRGEKYEAAIDEAIAVVKSFYPGMRIGAQLVKQILAFHQPREAAEVWSVTQVSPTEM